jgi:hypothetical protein
VGVQGRDEGETVTDGAIRAHSRCASVTLWCVVRGAWCVVRGAWGAVGAGHAREPAGRPVSATTAADALIRCVVAYAGLADGIAGMARSYKGANRKAMVLSRTESAPTRVWKAVVK